MLDSEDASALSPDELREIERILDAYPIEVAECRASEKQLDFQRCFFQRRDPSGRRCDVFVAMGANRSGKSYVAGWLCFAKYLRDKAKNGDWFWCVGQTLDRSVGGQQRELWKALPRWMFNAANRSHHAWKKVGQHWDEKLGFGAHRKIVLPTSDGGKCLVEFRSADQDASTFEQAKLTGVWCDERLPEAIYNRLLPRIVDTDGWILYSDIPEQFWQFERLKEAPPEAAVHFQHLVMHDNAHNLPPDAIGKAAARMTADERKLRIEGEFVVMEGIVFREYIDNDWKHPRRPGHLIAPFPIPSDWPRWRFIDYGGSAPTACGWVALAPDESAFIYREHYEVNKSVRENAKMMIAASGDEKYVCTDIDPHAYDPPPVYYGASDTIADQYRDAGIEDLEPWPLINQLGEHACVQMVKYRLENRKLFVFDNLINFRRELRSWKYKLDKDGKPVAADAFEDGNNHLLDGFKGWNAKKRVFTQLRIRKIETPR